MSFGRCDTDAAPRQTAVQEPAGAVFMTTGCDQRKMPFDG